jgi:ankyrin repeat protein
LHVASENGRLGVVRVLLEHGVDPNARDAHNATPTHLASVPAWEGESLDVIRLLLQYGSNIHALDNEGQTAFMRATKKGRRRIMQLLLENGAEDPSK